VTEPNPIILMLCAAVGAPIGVWLGIKIVDWIDAREARRAARRIREARARGELGLDTSHEPTVTLAAGGGGISERPR